MEGDNYRFPEILSGQFIQPVSPELYFEGKDHSLMPDQITLKVSP
jgi:hypothetical protein